MELGERIAIVGGIDEARSELAVEVLERGATRTVRAEVDPLPPLMHFRAVASGGRACVMGGLPLGASGIENPDAPLGVRWISL